jgi:hypothetical protein
MVDEHRDAQIDRKEIFLLWLVVEFFRCANDLAGELTMTCRIS